MIATQLLPHDILPNSQPASCISVSLKANTAPQTVSPQEMWADLRVQGSSWSLVPSRHLSDKNTAKCVDCNKLEGKTATINDSADGHDDVCKLPLKGEAHKKLALMERRGSSLSFKMQHKA